MTNVIMRSFRSASLVAVLGLVSGCVFTVPTDPNAYPVLADDFPVLPSGTTVEIVNGFPSSYPAKMTGNQQADLHDFTQTAVVVLGRALEKKGAVVASGGKRIVLEITGPTWSQGFGFMRGSVSLQAELGAAKANAWGEGSGVDASRNFSAAITHAVESLLKQPEFREYLSRP